MSRTNPTRVSVVDVYRMEMGQLRIIKSLMADVKSTGAEDEINVAVFAPGGGISDGILYGTQKGRIRIFRVGEEDDEAIKAKCTKATIEGERETNDWRDDGSVRRAAGGRFRTMWNGVTWLRANSV